MKLVGREIGVPGDENRRSPAPMNQWSRLEGGRPAPRASGDRDRKPPEYRKLRRRKTTSAVECSKRVAYEPSETSAESAKHAPERRALLLRGVAGRRVGL